MTGDFVKAFNSLLASIREKALSEKNMGLMLSMARVYGELLRLNHCGVYSDDEFELQLERKFLEQHSSLNPCVKNEDDKTIVIVSEFYDRGGHSEVLKQWLTLFKKDGNHEVIITQFLSKETKRWLDENNISYRVCHERNELLALEMLALCKSARQIVLFTHPEDIVSTIVARVMSKAGARILFYNHADHVFSYAIGFADMVCEISTYGIELNKRTGRVHNASVYLGIPIDFSISSMKRDIGEKGKVILTCGAAYKYKPSKVFIGDFIDDFLKMNTMDKVVFVGPDGDESWWKEKRKSWGARVVFLGSLSRSEYQIVLNDADVYLDSFPVTGGVAFPEALLNNKKVAGLVTALQGYSAVDSLRSPNIQALLDRVERLLRDEEEILLEMDKVKLEVEKSHSPECFAERVRGIYAGKIVDVAIPPVKVDTFELEKDWIQRRFIKMPYGSTLHNLTFIQCLWLFFSFLKVIHWCEKKEVIKLLVIILIKPIPIAFINRLLGR